MKRNWGRVGLVLVVALIGATAGPAPGALAVEACPSNLAPAGFVDLDGHSAQTIAAIDCISHYEITTGTGFFTFSPGEEVPRWQMAIFLARTARSLGITLPGTPSPRFTDIGGLDPATQIAINQITALGLTSGTSSTTFSPHQKLPRWQMAIFLTRLLERAWVTLPAATDQGFTDVNGLTPEATSAINRVTRLGVAAGTSATTFAPLATLPRWQMAIFLANALRVGGADPHGIKLTLSTSFALSDGLVVATAVVTGPDGNPLRDQLVDIFVASSLESDGTCVVDTDASVDGGDAGSSVDCEIDWADPKSDSEGRVTVLLTHDSIAEQDHVYAWIGPVGQKFDADTVDDSSTASITWSAVAGAIQISAPQTAAFGDPVTVTARLTTGAGAPVWGERIRFAVERGGVVVLAQTVFTAADGVASMVYSGPADPSAGDDPLILDTVRAFWDRDGDGSDDGVIELDAAGTVTWDD